MSHNSDDSKNKNKRDNNNEEDGGDNILKKQKLNKNNNYNKERSGGIDITDLQNQTFAQLKSTASTLGITIKHGIENGDLIEQIKIVSKRKQELLEKQEYDRNLNSFNKEIIEFKIKDGIDPLEWLFWKVFRNKFIYKKIMSNMNTQITPYHSIISVANMIKCNQLSLLRDKVIRNQHLSFNRNERNKFKEIFYAIRNDDDQDRLFYQQLFKHYGQYSLRFNNVMVTKDGVIIDNENGKEELVNEIIKTNCIPALQVLIQHYQYKPTIDNLDQAILSHRFKFVKLFLQPQSKLQMNNTLVEVKDEKLFSTRKIKRKLKRLSNNMKIECLSLKSLIDLSQLILKCNDQNGDDSGNTNIVSNEEIESFSNSLSKQELKSTLSDKSIQIQSKKEMIKKLLQLLYSFSNVKKSQFYYIYFNGDETYTQSDIGARQDGKEIYESFLRFADITLAPSASVGYYSEELIKESFSKINTKEPDFLFSHCQDKEKQMKFLNFIIGKIKKGNGIIDPIILFYLVIYNDDLDQIKYVSNELGGLIKKCLSRDVLPHYYITNYIKSTLVLEWLFENYYSFFNVHGGVINWFFKSVELVQHHEILHQFKFKSNSYDNDNNKNSGLIRLSTPKSKDYFKKFSILGQLFNIDVLKHIFKSGSNVYYQEKMKPFDDSHDRDEDGFGFCHFFSRIIYSSNYGSDNTLEMLKLVYLNFDGIDQLVGWLKSDQNLHVSDSFIRFMDWFYKNYQDAFNNTNFLINNDRLKVTLLRIGVYNGIDIDTCIDYIISDPNECSTDILDLILKENQDPGYAMMVNIILVNACANGKLNTIQHFYQNYSWLLIMKSESNPNGIFTTPDLESLLLNSLGNNQLAVSDYLFDLYSITKKQFDDRAGDLSKLYYRNKSFN